MLKILQARLQQYVNQELPDVQAEFRKHRGTRDQTANICWIIEKVKEFQKNTYFRFIGNTKAFDSVDHKNCGKFLKRILTVENFNFPQKLWKILKGNTGPPDLPPEKSVCRSRRSS